MVPILKNMKHKKFVKTSVVVLVLLVGSMAVVFFPWQKQSHVPQPQGNEMPMQPSAQPGIQPATQTLSNSTTQTAIQPSSEVSKTSIVYPSFVSLAFCSFGSIGLVCYVVPDANLLAKFFIGFFCGYIGWCGFRSYSATDKWLFSTK